MTPIVRKRLVIAAVAFAIATPAIQAMTGLGLSAAEFASEGNSTLRAAGYAFSIWALIYLGLIAHAVWQASPRNDHDPLLAEIAWPSIVAITGCGLWIVASALDWRWGSVAIIVVSAGALTLGLVKAARGYSSSPPFQIRLFVWWPLSLLAGWLTIAAAINILTVLTAEGLLADGARMAAIAGVAAVLTVGLIVLRTPPMVVYGAPIAWGLVGVWMAERASQADVAVIALAAAVLIGGYALWRSRPTAALR
jgi:hypothetical protein